MGVIRGSGEDLARGRVQELAETAGLARGVRVVDAAVNAELGVGRVSAGVDGCRRKVQGLIDGAICQGGGRVIAVVGTLGVCGLAQGVA